MAPPARSPVGPPATAEALERLARVGVGGAVPTVGGHLDLAAARTGVALLERLLRRPLTPEAVGDLRRWWAGVDVILELPRAVQRRTLELITARLRALQDCEPGAQVDDLFPLLSGWSNRHQPGPVFGLRRTDRPRHGSWDADAERLLSAAVEPPVKDPRNPERALDALDALDLATLPAAAVRLAVKRAVRDGLGATDVRLLKRVEGRLEALKNDRGLSAVRRALRKRHKASQSPGVRKGGPPEDWPFQHLTRGRTVVIVGGSQRVDARERLRQAFGFARLEWLDASGRTLDSVAARLQSGSVDLVLFTRYGGHIIDDKLLKGAIRADLSRWVRTESYGVQAVRLAMEAQWRGLLAPESRDGSDAWGGRS